MNKWLFLNGEILNLNLVNRIYIGVGNYCILFADYENEIYELSRGTEKEMRIKLRDIKEFLMSKRAEFMEME